MLEHVIHHHYINLVCKRILQIVPHTCGSFFFFVNVIKNKHITKKVLIYDTFNPSNIHGKSHDYAKVQANFISCISSILQCTCANKLHFLTKYENGYFYPNTHLENILNIILIIQL